jgi:hypothetical protein
MVPENLDPLSRLAIRFGSDKFGAHLYTPTYHRMFGHLRDQPLRVLEVGIGGYDTLKAGGSSLRMWAEYFPSARIVGLDISPKDLALPRRVTVVTGSQTDELLLQRLLDEHGPFDIVIDDGSHIVPHVLQTFRFLYPRLNPGAIYVVEDSQTSFMPFVGGHPDGQNTIFSLANAVVLSMHKREGHSVPADQPEVAAFGEMTTGVRVYRNLIVFERGDNTYPSNMAFSLADNQVGRVFALIEREAEDDPSPRGWISRIDMAIWGGDKQLAADLALRAAAANPGDVEVLAELVRLMEWAVRPAEIETIRGMLQRLGTS